MRSQLVTPTRDKKEMPKTLGMAFIIFSCLILGGCSNGKTETPAVEAAIDYATGKTPVESGRKAALVIKNISKNRDEDIRETEF